jgi:hypothetical protein
MCEIEIWKDIPEYEGLYQVSNWGRVKSLERVIIYKDGREKILPEKILKPFLRDEYYGVDLFKDGKRKMFTAHRLVALVFLENPDNLPQVNHRNEIKTDNRVENLEWCNNFYNCNYGTKSQRRSEKYKGENHPFYGKTHSEEARKKISEAKRKPILQFTLDNVFIREWESITSIKFELNINIGNICSCCQGKLKTCGGYIWKYKDIA